MKPTSAHQCCQSLPSVIQGHNEGRNIKQPYKSPKNTLSGKYKEDHPEQRPESDYAGENSHSEAGTSSVRAICTEGLEMGITMLITAMRGPTGVDEWQSPSARAQRAGARLLAQCFCLARARSASLQRPRPFPVCTPSLSGDTCTRFLSIQEALVRGPATLMDQAEYTQSFPISLFKRLLLAILIHPWPPRELGSLSAIYLFIYLFSPLVFVISPSLSFSFLSTRVAVKSSLQGVPPPVGRFSGAIANV